MVSGLVNNVCHYKNGGAQSLDSVSVVYQSKDVLRI